MVALSVPIVEMIPLDRINVINPRVRNKRDFEEVVSNIDRLGLKRPVTVTRREHPDGLRYDLVCGQGRVEAYLALKQTEIPALVIEASPEECLVKSLVENCARRHHRAVDLLRGIECLRRRGHSDAEIARKTDLSQEYVRGVFRLLEKGEHRLLRAVEAEQIPVSVAVEIADTDDAGTQRALQQAYEKNLLRGHRLLAAKRVIEQRRRRGKGLRNTPLKFDGPVSTDALLRAYRDDTDKKKLLIRKTEATRSRLVFVVEALRTLLADENFVTLLRAEGLTTLPRNLANRLSPNWEALR
jgi:ParB family chromosome partitioning protein